MALDANHKAAEKALFEPSTFLSDRKSKAVLEQEKDNAWDIIGKCSEMCAAAMLFLPPEELAKYPDSEVQG